MTLTRTPSIWEAALAAVDPLREDEQIDSDIGFEDSTPMRADLLVKGPLEQILRHYYHDHSDWGWVEADALALIASWREGERTAGRRRRTLAPLHNLRSMEDLCEIEPGLSVVRLGDAERAHLWRRFRAARARAPLEVTISQLESWQFAIDHRWRADRQPLDDNDAIAVIRDTLRALRLHHRGLFGITLIWTGPDPEDRWGGDHVGDTLSVAADAGPAPFTAGMPGDLGPGCPLRLRELLAALRAQSGDRRMRLVLDRFDSAYGRLRPEDRLIDLWIVFEALLLPEKGAELNYRAALRLARLVGSDPAERRKAFDTARLSYKRRSEVVHGAVKDLIDLAQVTESSRLLAVEALREWLLDPPAHGVEGLDHALLD